MQNDVKERFSAPNICGILVRKRLLTKAKAKEILEKKDTLTRELDKRRRIKQEDSAPGPPAGGPASIIDVIASLNLERADDKARILDEEMIYQLLAEEWKIPFKKIDPLKLDLNLVTLTIPRSFALRHLVLPIAITDGSLTVAAASVIRSS